MDDQQTRVHSPSLATVKLEVQMSVILLTVVKRYTIYFTTSSVNLHLSVTLIVGCNKLQMKSS